MSPKLNGDTPPGNRFRFRVRVVRAGEAKLRGRARGIKPLWLGPGRTKCYNPGARGGKKVYSAWFGEGDTPTDQIIYNETIESLITEKTFYTYQNGIPNLRLEISKYMNNVLVFILSLKIIV